jgi:LemA protein
VVALEDLTILILIVVGVLLVWAILSYNGLVSLRASVESAWSDIGRQLTHRYNLMVDLVKIVNASAAHEPRVCQQVAQACAQARQATTPQEKSKAEGTLRETLTRLFAIAESSPHLRANQDFLGLQQSLRQLDEVLQGARRYYNALVQDYNTKLMLFPDRLIAQIAKFQPKPAFQFDSSGTTTASHPFYS